MQRRQQKRAQPRGQQPHGASGRCETPPPALSHTADEATSEAAPERRQEGLTQCLLQHVLKAARNLPRMRRSTHTPDATQSRPRPREPIHAPAGERGGGQTQQSLAGWATGHEAAAVRPAKQPRRPAPQAASRREDPRCTAEQRRPAAQATTTGPRARRCSRQPERRRRACVWLAPRNCLAACIFAQRGRKGCTEKAGH